MATRRSPGLGDRTRAFIDTYTRDLTARDLQRVFTRETREMLAFFTQGTEEREATLRDVLRHPLRHSRGFFLAFAMRLTPARRLLYAVGLAAFVFGLVDLANRPVGSAAWDEGLPALLVAFALVNLLLLLEVADRLTLKHELGVARDIQRAMLPAGTFSRGGLEAHGDTQPANTVGGDFFDILPRPDGKVLVVLGDVAGKGSPAALLMALLLSMVRTLVDENLPPAALAARLNEQLMRHTPRSRFITMFLAVCDPGSGHLTYVNAGQNPPLLRTATGDVHWLVPTGMALGLSRRATFDEQETRLAPGSLLVAYSDGVTEAESPAGVAFDEAGLVALADLLMPLHAGAAARRIVDEVRAHAQDTQLADDITVLVVRHGPPRA
ncbi:MAG: PP2C family protein-serine/threonine phosphatase [Vicinamibacteria bacterium]